jgi:acyl dehydratase
LLLFLGVRFLKLVFLRDRVFLIARHSEKNRDRRKIGTGRKIGTEPLLISMLFRIVADEVI